MCMYMNIHLYLCLYVSEMKDGNGTGTWKKNSDYFVILRYIHYTWSGIMLFESELGLIVMYANSRATARKREEKVWLMG